LWVNFSKKTEIVIELHSVLLLLLVERQEEHPTCKKLSDEMLAWLSVCREVQMICT